MKVYFVRHTSVAVDGNHTCYGNTDVELRDTFEAEAAKTKDALSLIPVQAAFTSPLSRAKRLAHFCGFDYATEDNRLREMNFGEWEMLPWADIITENTTEEFFKLYIDNKTPGGESLNDQLHRVSDFISEKKAMGYQAIVVFCHGGVINCARTFAGQCSIETAFSLIPDFGSITMIEYN